MIEFVKKEFLVRMKQYLNDDYDKYCDELNKNAKNGITMNLNKLAYSSINLEDIIKLFNAELLYKNDSFACLSYEKDHSARAGVVAGKHPLHHVGLYYLQEPSAAKPLCELPINVGDAVLDLCASPGGKSVEALCMLKKECGGYLVANEINYTRVKALLSNIERMGFDNAIVTCESAENLSLKFKSHFDKIIVDAPCSGEGMFRKSIEARKQWSQSLVTAMSKLQRKIVDYAYDMLKKGGMMLYSTCTFSKEEDEEVVDYMLSNHTDLKLIKSEKLYPHLFCGEGQFYAIVKKDGSDDKSFKMPEFKDLSGLNVVRYWTNLWENKHGEKIQTHASTHIDSFKFDNCIDLNYDEAMSYLHGEALSINEYMKDGFYKVTYKKLGLGLGKKVRKTLKNHYPKGLRNL